RNATPSPKVANKLEINPLRDPIFAETRAIIAVRLLVNRTSVIANPFRILNSDPISGHVGELVRTKKYAPMSTPKKITSAPKNVQIPSLTFGTSRNGQLSVRVSSCTENLSLL